MIEKCTRTHNHTHPPLTLARMHTCGKTTIKFDGWSGWTGPAGGDKWTTVRRLKSTTDAHITLVNTIITSNNQVKLLTHVPIACASSRASMKSLIRHMLAGWSRLITMEWSFFAHDRGSPSRHHYFPIFQEGPGHALEQIYLIHESVHDTNLCGPCCIKETWFVCRQLLLQDHGARQSSPSSMLLMHLYMMRKSSPICWPAPDRLRPIRHLHGD